MIILSFSLAETKDDPIEIGNTCSLLMRFDSKKEEWSKVAPMQFDLGGFSLISCDNHIYSIGGALQPGVSARVVLRYDPVRDTWTECASMSPGRYKHRVAAHGNPIYVPGGWFSCNGTVHMAEDVDRYDTIKNRWEVVEKSDLLRWYLPPLK